VGIVISLNVSLTILNQFIQNGEFGGEIRQSPKLAFGEIIESHIHEVFAIFAVVFM
jgi:hypothetical protein